METIFFAAIKTRMSFKPSTEMPDFLQKRITFDIIGQEYGAAILSDGQALCLAKVNRALK